MALASYYREIMKINEMEDSQNKADASKALFEKLNRESLPEYFNWTEEVFEGIHVKERGSQAALLWVDLDTDQERHFTYSELAGKGNQFVNFLRSHGVKKGDSVYMMIPSVPESWFASLATIKAGWVSVPTAMNMTERELEYRFATYPPEAIWRTKPRRR